METEAESDLPPWKAALDAIIGSRHGGQVSTLLERLGDLDTRHPHVPEIVFQRAWTLESFGRHAEALPHYERAVTLGLAPNDHAAALIGWSNCLRETGQPGRAVEILEDGKRQFPEFPELNAYLALALHAANRSGEAVELLIETLLDTTEDPGLQAHQRALRFNAAQLRDTSG